MKGIGTAISNPVSFFSRRFCHCFRVTRSHGRFLRLRGSIDPEPERPMRLEAISSGKFQVEIGAEVEALLPEKKESTSNRRASPQEPRSRGFVTFCHGGGIGDTYDQLRFEAHHDSVRKVGGDGCGG